MKKKIIAFTLAIVTVLMLSGCGNGSLLGKWTATMYDDVTITREFKDDGTIIERTSDMQVRAEGTYTTDGDKLKIVMTLLVNEETGKSIPTEVKWNFSYSVKGNKLVLTDLDLDDNEHGKKITYTKE